MQKPAHIVIALNQPRVNVKHAEAMWIMKRIFVRNADTL